jgi:signal peptidase I
MSDASRGRRIAAVVGSLLVAPLGPLVLGHPRRVLTSFVVEAVALSLCAASVWMLRPWLLVPGVALGLLMRASMMVASLRLPARGLGAGRIWLYCIGVFVAEVVLAQTFKARAIEAFKIPAGSMIPTLLVGDHMFVDKRAREVQRGDVVVFAYPREPDKDFVKRVIAIGGDTVEVRDNVVWLNGVAIARRPVEGDCHYDDYDALAGHWESRRCQAFEETLDGRTWRVFQDPGRVQSFRPFTVPAGSFWVLGDNRDNSHDSRFWGAVPPDNYKGVARLLWWSSGEGGTRWERLGAAIR